MLVLSKLNFIDILLKINFAGLSWNENEARALFRHHRCLNSESKLLPGELEKSFLLVVAFCVPQPWQQAASWERRSCRTKASQALLRVSPALLSHVNSVCPYFIASLR